MGSSRLPGKVLRPLAGKPVLWHIVHRLHKCQSLEAIAVATSTNPIDDPIERFALAEGITTIRGSEDNVLERYVLAAEQLGADIVVRITGDAPLVDPAMVDQEVKLLIEQDADYCMPDPQTPCIHEGVDPFTSRALGKLVLEAGDDPVAREHVSAYFKKHPEFARIAYMPVDPAYQLAGARISVDTPSDLRFLEAVYARLGVPAGDADVRDVVRLLRAEPDLMAINSHVHQKGMSESSRRLLIRCDGDSQRGFGHIYRCLALADEMRDVHGWGITFAMVTGPLGCALIEQAGYPVEKGWVAGDHETEEAWLDRIIQRANPDALLLDVRTELTRDSVQSWRDRGVLIVIIDDLSERRFAADLAFYPPIPQVSRLDWTGFNGELRAGWEWVVLRKEFSQRYLKESRECPLILVTMGGSDPAGLTLRAVNALDALCEEFEAVVVLGPGFLHREALEGKLGHARRSFQICDHVSDMAALMAQADLAVASFGVTGYELAAMRVPAAYLCLTDDHVESASAFVTAGLAVCLGRFDRVTEPMLVAAIRELLNDVPTWRSRLEGVAERMAGGGCAAIARLIVQNCGSARRIRSQAL
jgi:spore coat polysaccharide biosynthesis protein SpsF